VHSAAQIRQRRLDASAAGAQKSADGRVAAGDIHQCLTIDDTDADSLLRMLKADEMEGGHD